MQNNMPTVHVGIFHLFKKNMLVIKTLILQHLDLIHGWNDLAVLRGYQRLYEGIRKSNPDSEIGISPILPRLTDKWKGKRPIREELTYIQLMNKQSMILNWRHCHHWAAKCFF